MTTRVPIRYGGTGANTAEAARTSLGAAPSIAYDQANTAYGQANAARSDANTTFATINTTFGTINTNITTANSQANLAYAQANAAIAAANNANLLLGGVITGTLNVTQDIIVGGNIYLGGNTTYINVSTYSVEDSLIYLASNNKLTDSVDIGLIGAKNTGGTYSHTGFARDATDGKWKLFDGLPEEGHLNNIINFNNSYLATLVANVEANTLSVINGVSGNVNFDSGTLFVDSINNRIGIGTISPATQLDVNGIITGRAANNIIDSMRLYNTDGNYTYLRTTSNSNSNNFWIDPTLGAILFLAWDNPGQARTADVYTKHYFGTGRGTTNESIQINRGDVQSSDSSGTITWRIANGVGGWGSNTFFNSGNIGIGTTSPLSKLDVRGTVGAGAATGGTENILTLTTITSGGNNHEVTFAGPSTGTNDSYLFNLSRAGGAYGAFEVRFGGTGRLYIPGNNLSNSGNGYINVVSNFGIGITNPTAKLHLGGTRPIQFSTNDGVIIVTADSGGWSMGTYYKGSSGTTRAGFGALGNADSLTYAWIGTGYEASWMTFLGSGNVGIGSTNPIEKLHVEGTNISAAVYDGAITVGGNRTRLKLGRDNNYNAGLSAYVASGQPGVDRVNLGFHVTTFTSSLQTFYEAMTIRDSGNVGVGTTNPGARLDVYPGASSLGSAGANGIRVHRPNAYGNYGYLEYLPGSQDAVLGSTYGGGAHGRIFFRTHDTSAGTSRDAMLINDSGNVGIGTTSPGYKLDVSGSIGLSGGITSTAAGGSILLKHAVSEADSWIFQENASNWGLYWKNAPSGNHTFGGYTTVGAELVGMSASNASGNGVATTNFVGATSAIAQWMISNYTGYIWSASTIYAAGSMSVGGNTVWHAGNDGAGSGLDADLLDGYSSSAYSGPNSTIKNFFWNDLSASGTQARRFEIARIAIDFNDWNGGTGLFEVELWETYYSRGLKKRYAISWGYVNSSDIKLVEYSGTGDNNFLCTIGSPVSQGGDNYYLPVYVDVKYYSFVDVRVVTNRDITTSSSPGIGQTYINPTPSPTNISDFTADSVVTHITNQSMKGSLNIDYAINFLRGESSYTNFIRAQNHPDQGYTTSEQKYWIELGSYGGTHVTLNMDGVAGSAENTFDHFTIWQAASNSTSGSRQFYVTNIGNVWARNNITAYSDERVKKDWLSLPEGFIEKLSQIKSGTFTRIDNGSRQAGVSAQSIREVLPEVVREDSDGLLSVAYGNAAMVSAVELAKEIVELKKQLAELREFVKGLK